MPLLTPRAKDLNELAEGAGLPVQARPLDMDEKAKLLLEGGARDLLALVHQALSDVADWTAEATEQAVREVAEAEGVKLGQVAQPLRAALTGRATSPGIFDVLVLLGREESLARVADQMSGKDRIDMADKAKLSVGGKDLRLCDDRRARSGPRSSTSASSTPRPAPSPTIRASPRPRPASPTITYIDGDAGILLHRGYPIDQLAEQSTFMEVCYLLLNGELPSKDELDKFTYTITRHTMLHEQLATFYRGFRRDAHPMAIMCGVVGALSAFYHDSADITDPQQRMIASHRLIAKMPTIAAMAYKYSLGQPFMYPQNSLSYTGNFLRMTFGVPAEPYEVNPVIENAMRRIFILHADHEQNASTSTVRLAGSSGANPFACIAAGIACLWGPAHGGANEAALTCCARSARPTNPQIYRAGEGQERPVPADGLRPPRLQEFRPAREGDAEDRRGGAEGARHLRSGARHRPGAGRDRAQGRLFHREEALSRTSISIRA